MRQSLVGHYSPQTEQEVEEGGGEEGSFDHAFTHVLPKSRLGQEHTSLESFRKAVETHQWSLSSNSPIKNAITQQKEYTLVVVTEPHRRRILLGLKQRGFGKGFYNSFGGKLDPGETDVQGARRELEEETGIAIHDGDEKHLQKVGILRYTFDDNPTEMIMHLFRLDIDTTTPKTTTTTTMSEDGEINRSTPEELIHVDPNVIRSCDEITPHWFDDWYDIPFNNMFADDSLWLTRLLLGGGSEAKPKFDGWFHFQAGGQEVNTILHYCITCRPAINDDCGNNDDDDNNNNQNAVGQDCTGDAIVSPPSYSLEQRLFHRLHDNQIRSPSIKEFKESFAFCNTVRSFWDKNSFDVIIDVAGGHGALAALFLITTSAHEAIVIDPAQVGKGSVQRAWGDTFFQDKVLRYRHECLRSGLPDELQELITNKHVPRHRILVVACHACQHLSEETLEIACRDFGVHAAVMPCCQKDTSQGSSWKALSKQIGVGVETVMDLLLAGKVMSWKAPPDDLPYEVRMKTINPKVTPQNRVILCRTGSGSSFASKRKEFVDKSHQRLGLVYQKAHENSA